MAKTMKFYMTPGSCSIGIHILLEELELLFQAHVIDLLAGDNRRPQYLAINPRGSVPTLVTEEGQALTDFQAIALWLAQRYPARELLPQTEPSRTRVRELLDYAINVIHGEGFTRIFVSHSYADVAGQGDVQREGRAMVERGFHRIAALMDSDGPYVSERFSVADVAVFYLEFWADRESLPLPARLTNHYHAMLQRPAVRQVLGEEGYHSTLRNHPAKGDGPSLFTDGRGRS